MSKQRSVNTRFWEDYYVSQLDPIEKLLFLYFITNSRTGLCGAYEIPLSMVAGETGVDRDMVRKIVDRFTAEDKIKYIDGHVIIKNYGKHIKPNPSIMVAIGREKNALPEQVIKELDTWCIQPVASLPTASRQRGTNLNLNSKELRGGKRFKKNVPPRQTPSNDGGVPPYVESPF